MENTYKKTIESIDSFLKSEQEELKIHVPIAASKIRILEVFNNTLDNHLSVLFPSLVLQSNYAKSPIRQLSMNHLVEIPSDLNCLFVEEPCLKIKHKKEIKESVAKIRLNNPNLKVIYFK